MSTRHRDLEVSFVVAVADNGVIGRDGVLPWRLRSDLRRFRKLTMGHPVVMGRKTFESIGRPLDGRLNIVLSRCEDRTRADGSDSGQTVWVHDIAIALDLAAQRDDASQVFVIGGAGVFAQALPFAQTIYLTRVHGSPEGDTHWTVPSPPEWREIARTQRAQDALDDYAVTDIVLHRVAMTQTGVLAQANLASI